MPSVTRAGSRCAGDFNGDGVDDVAVFRAGLWQVRLSGSGTTSAFSFGGGVWPNVVPVGGDWDGDGVDGIGFYCLNSTVCPAGTWNLRQTASAAGIDVGPFMYSPGSSPYPVVGDWDANGSDTVGVKTGTSPAIWVLNNQNDASAPEITFDYGIHSDLPVVWASPGP